VVVLAGVQLSVPREDDIGVVIAHFQPHRAHELQPSQVPDQSAQVDERRA
jgi:hypothetical protein